MAERDGNSAGTTLLAFAIGALAGAAVALLYAPASGEETRRKLRRRARDGRERVQDAIDHGKRVFEQARRGETAPGGGDQL